MTPKCPRNFSLPMLGSAFVLAACMPPGPVQLVAEDYRADAENGGAFAQTQFGQGFLLGEQGDLDKARYWLGLAAAQNEPQAIYLLGAMHERGHGLEKDMAQAHALYMRAARLNNGPAQEALARVSALGLMGPPDYVESHKWHVLSNKHGRMFYAADFMARTKLTAQQIKLAEAEAAKIEAGF